MQADAMLAALRTAMAHSKAPMVLSDPNQPDCPLVVVNDAFAALCGHPPAALLGRNCRFLQGPGTDPATPARIRGCISAGQGCIEWIVNHRADGTPFWNLLFISPIHDETGRLVFFFGNQLDITTGMPGWMDDVRIGPAPVRADLAAGFAAVLQAVDAATRQRRLDDIVAAAHRLAELSLLRPQTGLAHQDALA